MMELLIQDLMDYSQIKAGKFRKNYKKFDIKNTIKEAFGILKTKADAKEIVLEHDFENLMYQQIYHDEQRLK
jgi:signal transduction histidine kinase